jgi:hypothetical protein
MATVFARMMLSISSYMDTINVTLQAILQDPPDIFLVVEIG